MKHPQLILGSSSPYRKQQLENLGIRFDALSPQVEESQLADEQPDTMALRLGSAKARSVADQLTADNPWIVIGSDQVCHLEDQVFGKPGSVEKAVSNLRTFSGNWVSFSTSLVLLTSDGQLIQQVETFSVHFRTLSETTIRSYIDEDQPLDCAGAIKVEAGGIALLDDTRGRDINSLYGLPVMALCDGLLSLGLSIYDFK